ncbi:uncharacterized protein MELLADRAFT_88510 [Melampsora larici-populina 98AG31]|uniref:LNS2/PITP domain-containing protein n=1 Tax=Melampsora larici-populina (strain 98AG31 / pathotype 3-4-7) TaxID=747676 RepID=F4RS00_MELLP|nr:uncharacterized protein MELLADRAFT_88510 [Melampsora larici-populina 98AG31]EGG04865.1 hypothetical protein MELLADRAFT_88510 [Melampsora larici-populina 98AG31]
MSWLGRAISSVGQYYKEINPATLSGAIDVIVVSNKRTTSSSDNNSNEEENETTIIEDLACSPWHVRFGKLSVLRPVERKVRILINNQPAPFSMKIGETGEAFFVFETDVEDLPDDLQTSPLVSPCLESVETTSKRDPTSSNLEVVPDFNDLGESELATDPSQEWPTECNEKIQDSCESDLLSSAEKTRKNSELEKSSQTSQELNSNHIDEIQTSSELPREADQSPGTENVLPIMTLLIDTDRTGPASPHEDGDESRQAARAQDPHPLISQISPTSQISSEAELHTALPHHLHHGTNLPPGDLMLDMDGYKMTEDTEDDLSRTNTVSHFTMQEKTSPSKSFDLKPPSCPTPATGIICPGDELTNVKEEDVMEFTKALLTCSERINNQLAPTPNQDLSGDQIDHNVAVIMDSLQKEPVNQSSDKPQLADNLQSDHNSDCIIHVERIEGTDGVRTYDRFKLESNGTFHVFEISFYSSSFDGKLESASHHHHHHSIRPQSFDPQQFNQNRMCFEDYFTTSDLKDSILDQEANLIIKYNELSILTWDNASTALTSLGIYRKSILSLSQTKTLRLSNGAVRIVDQSSTDSMIISNDPTITLSDQTLVGETSTESSAQATYPSQSDKPTTIISPVAPSYTRPWSRWWYKNDQLSSTQTHHVRHHSEVAFTSNNEQLGPDEDKLRSHSSANSSPSGSPRSLPAQLEVDRSRENEAGQKTDKRRSTSAEGKPRQEATKNESPTTPTTPPPEARKHYAKTLRLTSDQLKQLGLKKGMNQVSFSVRSSYSGYAVCTSRIFLWESDYKICISDIDGTITKSDALGHVFTMIGRDWTHAGVAKLYTDIAKNGYKLMYLTSRAIGQADTTREYLKGINQLGYTLPDGPVIMSPDRLMTSLHREVIMRKPEVFKMACLRDIQRLFGKPNRKPFYAGFGNRITDALSYRTVEIPSSRIFTIDSNGEVKMELLELTGYKSSYIHMTDLVDQMFPPINRSSNSLPEFTDFNFWRSDPSSGTILNEVDLEELLSPNFGNPNQSNQSIPISPALSARSYESGPTAVSRLSFRLASSLSLGRKSSKIELNVSQPKRTSTSRDDSPGPYLGSHKKRLESDVGSIRSFETVMEEESDESLRHHQVPNRMRSDSMPGSLPGSLEEQSLLEGLRNHNESFEINPRRNPLKLMGKGNLESRKEGEPTEEDGEDEGEEENVEEDDDFPQMDFSAVPYL